MRVFALVALVVLLSGCARPGSAPTVTSLPTPEPTPSSPSATLPPLPPLGLVEVASGFEQPVLYTTAHDGTGRAFVVEQGGRIVVLHGGANRTFADLGGIVSTGAEQGLLGLAFPPDPREQVAYVSYTDASGDSTVARYHVASGDADRLDPASAQVLLHVAQPYANHNGGDIVFGPDGALYLGLGDGGSEGDPDHRGQDPSTLLSKLLRLDVADASARPEVWASGLRNPWRFSFDRATGDLWIGDVGQDHWEEIDLARNGTGRGANYGWSAFEGDHVYDRGVTPSSLVTPPVAEYSHDEGCAVTGGYVYRGAAIPALVGTYLFCDYCSGRIWALRPSSTGWNMTLVMESGLSISSFGEDDAGEVYVVDHGKGNIYRIALADPPR